MENNRIKKAQASESENITRKEALKRAGKYAAFTAASMLIVLSPKDSQAASLLPSDPGSGW